MVVRRRYTQSPVSAGVAFAARRSCRIADEAARLASDIGFPVAVKLASREIVHKTEVGGVRLNLHDGAAVRQAFCDIQGRS